MSIMMYPRPYASAWAGLTGGGMVKVGIPTGMRPRMRPPRSGNVPQWMERPGRGLPSDAGRRPPAIPFEDHITTKLNADLPQAPVVPVVSKPTPINPLKAGWEGTKGLIKRHPVLAGGAVAGGIASGGAQYGANRLAEYRAADAATAAAAGLKNQKPPPDPLGDTVAGVRDWSVNHWPILAGLGIGAGGLGLWWKQQQDRKEKEEEEELLSGMHSKAAMVKLASEFPVQVGFLVRCGERKLSGSEVRSAIEKCASISDAMAEEWTRFFDAAAGLEARASSGLVKAAVGMPGYSATANAAIADAAKTQDPTQSTTQPAAGIPPVAGLSAVKPTTTPPVTTPPVAPQPPMTNWQQMMVRHRRMRASINVPRTIGSSVRPAITRRC